MTTQAVARSAVAEGAPAITDIAARAPAGPWGEPLASSSMSVLTERVRAALTAGRPVHLTTINPDGSPQVSLIWVGLDGGEIVSGHLGIRQKLRNVERDPRIVLSMETGDRNDMGLDEYLVVHATAHVTDGGAPELLQALAAVYLGPGVKFPPFDDPPDGYVLRMTPTKVTGVGPWGEDD
jgi:PPOX class probable F420-dependent enzyme